MSTFPRFRNNKRKILLAILLPVIPVAIFANVNINTYASIISLFIPMISLCIIFPIMQFSIKIPEIIYKSRKLGIFSKFRPFNYFLKERITDSDFEIDSILHMSFWRMWMYITIFGWLLSIALADLSHFRIATDILGNPNSPSESLILASIFFMIVTIPLTVSFSVLDANNLLIVSKKDGTKTLVGKQSMNAVLAILGVFTIAKQTMVGLIEPIAIYMALYTLFVYHCVAIWYWLLFETTHVEKMRKYLIDHGVRVRNT